MSLMSTINPDLFLAKEIENGYNWTLASRLGDMLQLAQELFGPRDLSYTILGIEFVADNPRIRYYSNRREIIIQLDALAATDMSQACYQLAHETVHLLAPSGSDDGLNIEEGVACYFSAYYMRVRFSQPFWCGSLPSYKRVLDLVAPRLDMDLNCISRLRTQHPLFSQIPKDAVAAEFPALSSADVDFLVSKFNRDEM